MQEARTERRFEWKGRRRTVAALLRTAAVLCLAGVMQGASTASAAAAPATLAWTRYHADSSSNATVRSGGSPVAWSSPLIKDQLFAVSVVGDRVYTGGTGTQPAVYALDRSNGQLLWARRVDNMVMGQPLVVDGRVFVGTGNNTSFMRGNTQYFGTGSNSIYALNAATGAVLWRLKIGGDAMPTPVYDHGVLYWDTGGRRFLAIDAVHGTILWQIPLPSFASMSSPVKDGNLVIFGGARPYAEYAVDVVKHRIAWQYRFGTWQGLPITNGVDDCSPALYQHLIYCSGSASVDKNRPTGGQIRQFAYALNAQTGKLVWQVNQGAGFRPPFFAAGVPMVANGTVYVASPGSQRLWALDAQTGRVKWKTDVDFRDRSAPVLVGQSLFMADDAGDLYQIDARTGRKVHRLQLGGGISNVGIVVVDGSIYVPNSGGIVDAVPVNTITSAPQYEVKPMRAPLAAGSTTGSCG